MNSTVASNFRKLYNDNGEIPLPEHAVGRFLEEVVELALASGLTTSQVMDHVMDTIHNESRKAKKYPSRLNPTFNDSEFLVELTDCHMFLSSIIGIYTTPSEQVLMIENAIEKTEEFLRLSDNGELNFTTTGTFYRKAT